jgi:hypothetical protein
MSSKKQKAPSAKPDTILNDYWRDNERFADLFNQVVFKGSARLEPDKLREGDTNEATVVYGKDGSSETVIRHRDVVKSYNNSTELVIVGIENQTEIHYAMPARSMLYDALNYARQCKQLENKNRKNGHTQTAAEFLSGMKKGDRIAPIISLVIYYGDEYDWEGPLKLSDMMDVGDDIKGHFNDYELKVLNMREAERLPFKNEENRKLFTMVGQYRRKGKSFDFNDFEEEFVGLNLNPETLAAVGAIIGEQKCIDYAYKNKDREEINMYAYAKAMRDYFKDEGLTEGMVKGMAEGRAEGRAEGMTLINLLNEYLFANNLMDELKKSISDRDYQNELIAKYNITVNGRQELTDAVKQ